MSLIGRSFRVRPNLAIFLRSSLIVRASASGCSAISESINDKCYVLIIGGVPHAGFAAVLAERLRVSVCIGWNSGGYAAEAEPQTIKAQRKARGFPQGERQSHGLLYSGSF